MLRNLDVGVAEQPSELSLSRSIKGWVELRVELFWRQKLVAGSGLVNEASIGHASKC